MIFARSFRAALVAAMPFCGAAAAQTYAVDCQVDTICDGLGACAASDDIMAFGVDARTGDDGALSLVMDIGGMDRPAEQQAEGLVAWEMDGLHYKMIPSGPENVVVIAHKLTGGPVVEIRFMTCEGLG